MVSCHDNANDFNKSYLVIKDGDSTYVQFEKNDNGEVIRYSALTNEEFIDIYRDSLIKYCIESKMYSTYIQDNILSSLVEGNWFSSVLFSIYKDNGKGIGTINKIDTTEIGDYKVQESSVVIKEDHFTEYCDYKMINGIVDSNCLKIMEHPSFVFNIEGFKKVIGDEYIKNCSYYSWEKINIVNYLREKSNHSWKRYILVDFFMYYCGPCIKAIPKLNVINEHNDIKVIGMHHMLEDKQRLVKFKNTFGSNYDLFGEEAVYYYENTEVKSFPHYVLLNNRNLQVIEDWIGYHENLEELVIQAINTYESNMVN